MLRVVFLAAGATLFVYLAVQLGPGAVLEMLGRLGWNAVVVAVIYTAYQSLRAVALSASVTGGRALRWRDALRVRLAGEAVQFLTFTGPFLAEPTKAWMLTARGLSAVEGFAATLTEYLVYTFVAALITIVGIGWLLVQDVLEGGFRVTAIVIVAGTATFLLVAAGAIVLRFHLLGTILQRIAGLPGLRSRLRTDMAAVHRMEDLLLGVLHDRPARFGWIALVEAGSHVLHMFELYWIMRALELAIGMGTVFLIEAATKFVGMAFFFIPGQVGASEGAHTVVFELVGLPAVAGFTVPFVRRIRSVVVAAVGLLAMSRVRAA